MLVRSAGRRQQRHTTHLLAASFAQLNLPWLAPAQLRWSATHPLQYTHDSPERRRPSFSRSPLSRQPSRTLATAAGNDYHLQPARYMPPTYDIGSQQNTNANVRAPFAGPTQSQIEEDSSFSSLRPYSDPIIINRTIQSPAALIKISHGLYGTAMELLSHLHTSLQVGRLGRAEIIIRRIAEQASPTSPELLHAHTAYLEESLRTLASQGRSEEAGRTLRTIQSWFEMEVRKKGVQPDARMLVVMIRVAIRGHTGNSRIRAIRRYTEWAQQLGPEVHDEVLISEDYDDNEFTILGFAASELYDQQNDQDLEEPTDPDIAAADARLALETPSSADAVRTPQGTVDIHALPEVRPTDQKGESLANVKKAMQTFVDLPPLPPDAPLEARQERALERQRVMEETSVDIAIDKWRKSDNDLRKIGIFTALQNRPLGALMWQWYQALLPALEQELREVQESLSDAKKSKDHERSVYGPFMELLPMSKLAANTILHIMSRMAPGKSRETAQYESEQRLTSLADGLGRQFEAEALAEVSLRKAKGVKQPKVRGSRRSHKALMQKIRQKGVSGLSIDERARLSPGDLSSLESWPAAVRVKLGAMAIEKLIEAARLPVTREHPRTKEKVTQMQSAFLHRIKYVLGKKNGVLAPNPALLEKLQSEPAGSLIAKRMPMVVEPKRWTGWKDGGYLHYSNSIMRLRQGDKSGKDYFMAADKNGDMEQVYAGLTALSRVPWRVHPGVLKAQIEAWNTGEPIANFAPLRAAFDMPPEPNTSSDSPERHKWLKQLREIENQRSGNHSKRCFQNFQLEIARTVADETLYFPHNMDFRGRAYPIPPYLNHMGADNVRGLLVFADAKPLGETGLRWLKIHTATVAGHDKASMEERLKFTEEHLDDIRDSATNPLGGRRWWLRAEDAWQTLAACFELTAALDSPDPTQFLSSLPVQQDGTCNGLQHYAALGGDEIGARQVNLEPGDRPSDVYTAVAESVKEQIRVDAESGHEIAKMLHGHITRKCVKQPVMTNVYGVTFFGAREQVQKQLEVIFPSVQMRPHMRAMASYVTAKIFSSLGTMFRGAQAIQTWLGQCAGRIATSLTPEQINDITSDKYAAPVALPRRQGGTGKAKKPKAGLESAGTGSAAHDKKFVAAMNPLFKSTVVWTTPMRMPVVQPYRKSGTREVKTNLQDMRIAEPQVWDPVSKRKQLQAFPPNFIHSLDATHMLLSALKCTERGLTFASIHDSFWSHACDVNTLSTVLRDAFVEMHSEDVIGRLREEFETRYKDCMYLATVPAHGEVGTKITELRKGMKTTATGPTSELALERERLRLLASADAEERAKGEAMVTPASFLDQEDEPVLATNELDGHTLGDMPQSLEKPASDGEGEKDRADVVEDEGENKLMDLALEEVREAKRLREEQQPQSQPEKKLPKYLRKLSVWLPMRFPPVPAKGAFDVRKLKESRYFFH